MPKPVLSFDNGGKFLRAAVVIGDQFISKERIDTHTVQNNDELNQLGKELTERILSAASVYKKDILGIGAGSAGTWDGLVIRLCPNSNVRSDVTLFEYLAAEYGLPAIGGNDLKVQTFAVSRYGHAKGRDDIATVVGATYSDGNNIGVVHKGESFPGYKNITQEAGHSKLIIDEMTGRLCGCGSRGCIEQYVSGTSASRMAIEDLLSLSPSARENEPIYKIARLRLEKKSEGSLLPEQILFGIKAEDVYGALKSGQESEIAKRIKDIQNYAIATQFAQVSALVAPQMIEYFGGMTKDDDLIFQPAILDLKENQKRYTNPTIKIPEILKSDIGGDDLGLLGGAAMVYSAHEKGQL